MNGREGWHSLQSITFLFSLLLFGVGFYSAPCRGVESNLSELIKSGQFEQAYNDAQDLRAEQEGDPDFDFLYGLAALESGKSGEAVFAFERVILQQPWNHRAHLELARTYYQLRDFDAARNEFDLVLNQNPPASVAVRIKSFISDIQQREAQLQRRYLLQFDTLMGYDSNINSATENREVFLPIFGQVPLNESSRAVGDEYYEYTLALSFEKWRHKTQKYFLALDFKNRDNLSSQDYDLLNANLRGGIAWEWQHYGLSLPLSLKKIWLNQQDYRDDLALGLEWKKTVGSNTLFSLVTQWGPQRYNTKEQTIRDANVAMLGLNVQFNGLALRSMVQSTVYYAAEKVIDQQYELHSRDYSGLRLQWNSKITSRHRLSVLLGAQFSQYLGENPFFIKTRQDIYQDLSLQWHWQLSKRWRYSTQFDTAMNQSNISLYEYRRNQFSLAASFAWDK